MIKDETKASHDYNQLAHKAGIHSKNGRTLERISKQEKSHLKFWNEKKKEHDKTESKTFDISTEAGMKNAERFQSKLYKKYSHVKIEPSGYEKVKLIGMNK